MRVLAATIGALLISVGHAALAQERHDAPPQREQQGETLPPVMTAEELLAQLPEREPLGDDATEPPAVTAEELLEQLPEFKPTEVAATQTKAVTAEELLAQLPEFRPAGAAVTQTTAVTAETLLVQLPERKPPTMTARALLAQLPDRKPPSMTAMALLPQLPDHEMVGTGQSGDDGPMQPEAMSADAQQVRLVEADLPRDPKWMPFSEPNLSITMDFPRAVFSRPDGYSHQGMGRRYGTPDGRATVAIWTQRNNRQDTPVHFLNRIFDIPGATVDYERSTPDFAVVSGVYGSKIYYIRCNLSRREGSFHCFDLAYPAREKKAWDGIVTRMSLSLDRH